jgi:hypothetical protein
MKRAARRWTISKQVQKVAAKGNKALGFIHVRRNVGSCPEEVKKQAYLTLVRSHLEYASSAWMMESQSSRWFNDVGWYWYRYFFMDGFM